MFHLKSIELVHWDYWQRFRQTIDASIVAIVGPNGSGKTTLLDALRTLFALQCAGKRDYKRYVRHSGESFAWLRAVVDNRRIGNARHPFFPLLEDEVTLVCRIRKQGGDWQRQYLIAPGDAPIDEAMERSPDWLGVRDYERRLASGGLSAAIAQVLSLEQGETDRLCEYTPKALLDLVFHVFGDKRVLDDYTQARADQRDGEAELDKLDGDLARTVNEHETFIQRANRYQEWRGLKDEETLLEAEIRPRVELAELRLAIKSAETRLDTLRRQSAEHQARIKQEERRREHSAEALAANSAAQLHAAAARETAAARHNAALVNVTGTRNLLAERDKLRVQAASVKDSAQAAARLEQNRPRLAELQAGKMQRTQRRSEINARLAALRGGMPAAWLDEQALEKLLADYGALQTVHLRIAEIQSRLTQGQWETDATVLARRDKLAEDVHAKRERVEASRSQCERAKKITEGARGEYLNVLRATVRNYGRHLKELGLKAGIEVEWEMPHLANDDIALAQAGLNVKFNFDQKGMIGMNDGEASGGQQVMKSLILLIALTMETDRPGGFVFIDEPFAHLDVMNIDRVAAFLRATQAQYLITTPSTHNQNVFSPVQLTLVTQKNAPVNAGRRRWRCCAAMTATSEDWSAPDADGIRVRGLDVGAKTTLRGRRLRRAVHADAQVIATWPAAWRDLLAQWLDGASKRRWDTLISRAGNNGFAQAHDLLAALLRAGLVEIDESRERSQWKPRQVTFVDPAAIRAALGLPNNDALREQLTQELAALAIDNRLTPLWRELAAHPPARGLERVALLRKLDTWLAENRFGTRRDFALFARGTTKAVSSAEWKWLETLPDFDGCGIERHVPALWLRAPLTLCFGGKTIDLSAIPDMIGLSPETLALLEDVRGDIGYWRLVENRTSFERVAREHGAADGVIWLPGFAPGWWKEAVRRILRYKPAPAEIACDPDPAGINIALDAGSVWQACGLAWSPWKMAVNELMQLKTHVPLSSHDKVVLERLLACALPPALQALVQWMHEQDAKGEQESYL